MELEILFLCGYFNAVRGGRMLNMFINTSTQSDLSILHLGWYLILEDMLVGC